METTLCAQCNMECTQKSGLLTCTRCKSVTHFTCSKLPKYCFNLLQNFNTVYVCETCAEESSASTITTTNTSLRSANESNRSNDTIRTLRDIQSALKEITSEMENAHMGTISESIDTIDYKIEQLETRIEEKLRNYLNKKLLKHKEDIVETLTSNDVKGSSASNDILTVSGETRGSSDVTSHPNALTCNKCMCLEQDMKTKDSRIEILRSELSEQKEAMTQLERDSDALLEKHSERSATLANLNVEVEDYKHHPRSSYVEQLKQYIKILELQISVNNEQNEILTITREQKDSKLVQLRNQIRDMSTRLGTIVEEASKLPDSISSHVSNQRQQHPDIPLMVGSQRPSVPQPPYSAVLSSFLTRRNVNHMTPHPKMNASNIQSNPHFTTSPTSTDNSDREDVVVVDGSLYQRVGHLQQG